MESSMGGSTRARRSVEESGGARADAGEHVWRRSGDQQQTRRFTSPSVAVGVDGMGGSI